jgi:uncharacterized membrane protein
MDSRPKIRISLTPLDKFLETISVVLLVLIWVLVLYSYPKLPGIIPIHYDAAGEVNGYGNKTTILIFPFIALAVYILLTRLNKYPHVFNYMSKITEENAQKQYTMATRMIRYLKLIVLLTLAFITGSTYLTTTGITKGPGSWFLPCILAMLFIPTIILIVKSFRTK